MGYWICDWCGSGSSRVKSPTKQPKHNHLLKNQPCNGPQRWLDLGHAYETDLLSLKADVSGIRVTHAGWLSAMYAIVEAASEILEIARDDIGGSLSPIGEERWSITLFDAVPGGAGHVLQVEEHLEDVLSAALRRVSDCECGPETSCYGCLRSYQNQRDHDHLSRGTAEQVLRRLIDNDLAPDSDGGESEQVVVPDALPDGWADLYRGAFGVEREILISLGEGKAPRPEIGFESAGGTPISIAWPDRLLALDIGLDEEDRRDLKSEGWKVLSLPELQKLFAKVGV
jgi:hypothetical protein